MELIREVTDKARLESKKYLILINNIETAISIAFEHKKKMFELFKEVKKVCPHCKRQTKRRKESGLPEIYAYMHYPDFCEHKDVKHKYNLNYLNYCRFRLGEDIYNLPKIYCPMFQGQ